MWHDVWIPLNSHRMKHISTNCRWHNVDSLTGLDPSLPWRLSSLSWGACACVCDSSVSPARHECRFRGGEGRREGSQAWHVISEADRRSVPSRSRLNTMAYFADLSSILTHIPRKPLLGRLPTCYSMARTLSMTWLARVQASAAASSSLVSLPLVLIILSAWPGV